jgi:hypothetical protein
LLDIAPVDANKDTVFDGVIGKAFSDAVDSVALDSTSVGEPFYTRLRNLSDLCNKYKNVCFLLEAREIKENATGRNQEIVDINTSACGIVTREALNYLTLTPTEIDGEKYKNIFEMISLLREPTSHENIARAPLGATFTSMLENKDTGATLLECFGCKGDAQQFREMVAEIKEVLSKQDKSVRDLRQDFVKLLRENPKIKKGFESIFSAETTIPYFAVYQYLFSYVKGTPTFADFLEGSLKELKGKS